MPADGACDERGESHHRTEEADRRSAQRVGSEVHGEGFAQRAERALVDAIQKEQQRERRACRGGREPAESEREHRERGDQKALAPEPVR